MQRQVVNPYRRSRPHWDRELAAKGMTHMGRGGHGELEGVEFCFDRNWPVLKTKMSSEGADPLVGQMGKPGLWKFVAGDKGLYRIFDLPPPVLTDLEGDVSVHEAKGPSRFGSMLTWALDTIKGDRPAGWHPPPREEVDPMIPPGWLILRSGAQARQGELLHGPGCLALRFPIVQHVPESLPDCRIYWLRRLLLDAQTNWRLARVGSVGDFRGSPVYAEVNLTGAPRGVLADMISLALAALRALLEWTVAPAVYLVDRANDGEALEMFGSPPFQRIPKEKGGD